MKLWKYLLFLLGIILFSGGLMASIGFGFSMTTRLIAIGVAILGFVVMTFNAPNTIDDLPDWPR